MQCHVSDSVTLDMADTYADRWLSVARETPRWSLDKQWLMVARREGGLQNTQP
jgi:hypothetical protein